MTFEPHLEVLPAAQRAFWQKRPAIPPHFVLYGGTAIALRLSHRSSEDFDFFSSENFTADSLLAALRLPNDPEILQSEINTLTVRLDCGGPVKLSFFGGLSFGRIADPDSVAGQSFRVASLGDLIAAKLKVLWQRAEAKDYLDVAALIRAGLSLEYGLGCAGALYGAQFNPAIVLKALTYFEDGDLPTLAPDVRQLLIERARNVRELAVVHVIAARVVG